MALVNKAGLERELGQNPIYTGEYIKNMAEKDFATLNQEQIKTIQKMAGLGASQSMKSSLEKIEGQAGRLGYNVFYEFNKSTNTSTAFSVIPIPPSYPS